jgi:hypothetical protein
VWPDALPYRLLLSPELDKRMDFTNQGHTLGNLVVRDCHPTSRDFAGGLAVVFHEMSHTLSMQQRLALQRQVEKCYLTSAAPGALPTT